MKTDLEKVELSEKDLQDLNGIETTDAPTVLDNKSAYDIATTGRTDNRSNLEVASDVVDLEMLPEIAELYKKLGLFDAEDSTVFSLPTLMSFLKEGVATGAEIEKEHPGLVGNVMEKKIPKALAKVVAARERN